MATPTNSFVMACDSQPSYRTKLVDGTEVIQEVSLFTTWFTWFTWCTWLPVILTCCVSASR